MTKTEARKIGSQLRMLRTDRKHWLCGRYMPDGVPWCRGPGSPAHQPPLCEGCMGREWAEERAAPITEEIRRLEALLEPAEPVQVTLW